MCKTKRVWFLAGIVVLCLATLFGCDLLWEPPERSGGYIQLNIGDPRAKAINVSDYDVTALSIAVYDPEDKLLKSIDWNANEGDQSYSVKVNQSGTHRIEVTHIGENNGEVVEADESAEFDIAPMVITVIDITPGAIGLIRIDGEQSSEQFDLSGYWDFYWTLEEMPELGPVLLCMEQTDSTLTSDMEFTGSITGSTVMLEAWMEMGEGDPLYVRLDGTVSGADGVYQINGDTSGDMGTGTFRMSTPSEAPFGRLDLEGEVDGVPISLHTDYALGSGGGTEEGIGQFELMYSGCDSHAYLWLHLEGPLEVGVYQMPADSWWLDLDWQPAEGPSLDEVPINDVGTLTITSFVEGQSIAGSFDALGGALTCSFNVGFWEQWEPE
jgi:hypothetical protein